MRTKEFDIHLCFGIPCKRRDHDGFAKLVRHFNCVESVEKAFQVEFSCGDGKYLSDLDKLFMDDKMSEEDFSRYDGQVDLTHPLRVNESGELITHARFQCFVEDGEAWYYLNGRMV